MKSSIAKFNPPKNELMLFKRDDNRGYGASNLVDSLQVMYVKYNDN